ncbi:MAG: hypothetical protein COA52_01115 [Hyphomicrobiales bacterium]|nr:MAG: hypothetical protein COA52_00025 [Hyphomicrobiales bacterium]PCJ96840.1 MAG: hypothetical protein COA52_01115 [Hyphomicrobiales bacterium]
MMLWVEKFVKQWKGMEFRKMKNKIITGFLVVTISLMALPSYASDLGFVLNLFGAKGSVSIDIIPKRKYVERRRYYYVEQPRYRQYETNYNRMYNHVNWCYDNYKSFDEGTNTWQPYYGSRKFCRSPFIR